jgi:hypothetical protein
MPRLPTSAPAIFEDPDCTVPFHLRGGIARYLEQGVAPGDFLCAVLRGDLKDATARGDHASLPAIPALLLWLHRNAPAGSWGTTSAFEAWITGSRSPSPNPAQVVAEGVLDTILGLMVWDALSGTYVVSEHTARKVGVDGILRVVRK